MYLLHSTSWIEWFFYILLRTTIETGQEIEILPVYSETHIQSQSSTYFTGGFEQFLPNISPKSRINAIR